MLGLMDYIMDGDLWYHRLNVCMQVWWKNQVWIILDEELNRWVKKLRLLWIWNCSFIMEWINLIENVGKKEFDQYWLNML